MIRSPFQNAPCRHVLWLAILTGAVATSFAVAADPDNPFATEQEKIAAARPRTWNDKQGKFSVEAKLLKVEDGKAVLKRSDGQEINVPLERLSDADQKFIASITGKQNDAAAVPSTDKSGSGAPTTDAPAMKLVATDFHSAKVLDLSGSGGWTYKPDLACADRQVTGRADFAQSGRLF